MITTIMPMIMLAPGLPCYPRTKGLQWKMLENDWTGPQIWLDYGTIECRAGLFKFVYPQGPKLEFSMLFQINVAINEQRFWILYTNLEGGLPPSNGVYSFEIMVLSWSLILRGKNTPTPLHLLHNVRNLHSTQCLMIQ